MSDASRRSGAAEPAHTEVQLVVDQVLVVEIPPAAARGALESHGQLVENPAGRLHRAQSGTVTDVHPETRRLDRPVPPMAGTAAIGAVVHLLATASRRAGTCPR